MQLRVDNHSAITAIAQRWTWVAWNACQFVFTLLWTAAWVGLALGLLVLSRRRDWALRMVSRCWAPGLLAGACARLEVEGAERVDWSRPYLLVANHPSVIDAGADLLPVAIAGAGAVLPVDGFFRVRQGCIRVRFGDLLPIGDAVDRQSLAQQAHASAQALSRRGG
ncbi:MAG: hypothetical protein ACR2J7_08185 [Luteimonas sp.]